MLIYIWCKATVYPTFPSFFVRKLSLYYFRTLFLISTYITPNFYSAIQQTVGESGNGYETHYYLLSCSSVMGSGAARKPVVMLVFMQAGVVAVKRKIPLSIPAMQAAAGGTKLNLGLKDLHPTHNNWLKSADISMQL